MKTQNAIKSVCHKVKHAGKDGVVHVVENGQFAELVKATGKSETEVMSELLGAYRAHNTLALLKAAKVDGMEAGTATRAVLDENGKKIIEINAKGNEVVKQEEYSYEYPVLFNDLASVAKVIEEKLTPKVKSKVDVASVKESFRAAMWESLPQAAKKAIGGYEKFTV